MKVYELMAALETMAAGADVYVSNSVTPSAIEKMEKLDDDLYAFTDEITEIEYDNEIVSISVKRAF